MRVIAGTCRSMPLAAPPGADTRPTTDRIKETLFNILMNEIPGCRFLDLFAGSGGIGIEALSRGASRCCFVDSSRQAIDVIKKNLAFTGLGGQADILQMDAAAAAAVLAGEEPFDVVFMDPPYGKKLELPVLDRLSHASCIGRDTLLILETALQYDTAAIESAGFSVFREKKYKTNQHLFFRRQ